MIESLTGGLRMVTIRIHGCRFMAGAVYARMCVSEHRTRFAKVFLELEASRSLDPCNLHQIHEKDDYSSN